MFSNFLDARSSHQTDHDNQKHLQIQLQVLWAGKIATAIDLRSRMSHGKGLPPMECQGCPENRGQKVERNKRSFQHTGH